MPDAAAKTNLAPPVPNGMEAVVATFGNIFAYLRDDGTIEPSWERDQLGRAVLPAPLPLSWQRTTTVTSIQCHRKLVPVLERVYGEIHKAGLWDELDSLGGCYAFRPQRGSTAKLSLHSWGIAVDHAPDRNPLYSRGRMHRGIVNIFTKYGFFWGGDFKRRKDPMHFQYAVGV